MATTFSKLRYLTWASRRFLGADTSCPACNELRTVLVRRKYFVTSLYRCPSCELMFRVPKPSASECRDFYQSEYEQGFTTDCPSPEALRKMKDSAFVGTPKDYSGYLDVLRSIPLTGGSTILDYGCSWGYGSWQLARAGYRVYSFEISRPRARYAAEKLECTLCAPQEISEKVDCLFSSHVIEHLTNPRLIWEIAQGVLKPEGIVVLFLPNGNPSREALDANYHKHWGQVHPLLISPIALMRMGEHYGFSTRCYSSPYILGEIATNVPGDLTGAELLVIATR